MNRHWYNIDNATEIDSPALLVYPERVRHNIDAALNIQHANRLRPHIKTCKSRQASTLMLEAGISSFKCSTIAEAELLAICGAKDVLLAQPPTLQKLIRLKALMEKYPQTNFSCVVDNAAVVGHAQSLFEHKPLQVFIDANVGQHRTGIDPAQAASFIAKILQTKNVLLKGIHAYDGHIHEASFETRKQQASACYAIASSIKKDAEKLAEMPMKLVIGGTPSFPFYAAEPDTECSPGTFVFWDAGYSKFTDMFFVPAVVLLTRIISIINKKWLCLDAGYKAVAAENALDNRVVFLNGSITDIIAHYEEHLVVEVEHTDAYKVGDAFYALPVHICPTVALHQVLYEIRNHKWTGAEWDVQARNRKICC